MIFVRKLAKHYKHKFFKSRRFLSNKSMAYGYLRILTIVAICLVLGLLCSDRFYWLNVTSQSSTSNSPTNNETTGDRLVNRAPEYHGSIFANQITVATDKESYEQGEKINVTITNEGTRPVHFSSADSKIEIKNLKTNETLVPPTVLLSQLIPSGGSMSIIWNQQDFTGIPVDPGMYLAQVFVGPLNSSAPFTIR